MIQTIDIELISPKPGQPRQVFDAEKIQGLADSISEIGLQQPIKVRPKDDGHYEIVQGERRWRACKLLGLATIQAIEEDLDDDRAYVISVVENEQRENLTPIETAEALQHMMTTQNLTQEGVAKKIGRSRTWVTQKLRLLNLPAGVKDTIRDQRLSESHARQLLKLKGAEADITALAEQAASGEWAVGRLETEVNLILAGNGTGPQEETTTTGRVDKLIESDQIIDSLTSCVESAAMCFKHGPGLLKRIIQDDRWRAHTLTRGAMGRTGEVVTFSNFAEFVTMPPPAGLGTDIETLKRLCAADAEAVAMLIRLADGTEAQYESHN